MVRFALDDAETLRLDYRGLAHGRGAWLCGGLSTLRCFGAAAKRGAFNRTFKRAVRLPDGATVQGELRHAHATALSAMLAGARRARALRRASESEPLSARTIRWGDPQETWVVEDDAWFRRVSDAQARAMAMTDGDV